MCSAPASSPGAGDDFGVVLGSGVGFGGRFRDAPITLVLSCRRRPGQSLPSGLWRSWRKPSMIWKVKTPPPPPDPFVMGTMGQDVSLIRGGSAGLRPKHPMGKPGPRAMGWVGGEAGVLWVFLGGLWEGNRAASTLPVPDAIPARPVPRSPPLSLSLPLAPSPLHRPPPPCCPLPTACRRSVCAEDEVQSHQRGAGQCA